MTDRRYRLVFIVLVSAALLLLGRVEINAQVKSERELEIKAEEFPDQSMRSIDRFENKKKIHYYKEYDEGVPGYESKFKWKGNWLSIEFDSSGQWLDLEKRQRFRSLPAEVRAEISNYFNSQFDRWTIDKVQKQFTLDEPDERWTAYFIDDREDRFVIHYELECTARSSETTYQSYEFLFDRDGKLVRRRPIADPSMNNILH